MTCSLQTIIELGLNLVNSTLGFSVIGQGKFAPYKGADCFLLYLTPSAYQSLPE